MTSSQQTVTALDRDVCTKVLPVLQQSCDPRISKEEEKAMIDAGIAFLDQFGKTSKDFLMQVDEHVREELRAIVRNVNSHLKHRSHLTDNSIHGFLRQLIGILKRFWSVDEVLQEAPIRFFREIAYPA
jgi:hypothetical protein